MKPKDIKVKLSDIQKYETAAYIAAEIVILNAEIKRHADEAAKQILKKISYDGYIKERNQIAEKLKQVFCYQEMARAEIKKVRRGELQ
jgi:hypothetical protein